MFDHISYYLRSVQVVGLAKHVRCACAYLSAISKPPGLLLLYFYYRLGKMLLITDGQRSRLHDVVADH
jgi:hypothetical protein